MIIKPRRRQKPVVYKDIKIKAYDLLNKINSQLDKSRVLICIQVLMKKGKSEKALRIVRDVIRNLFKDESERRSVLGGLYYIIDGIRKLEVVVQTQPIKKRGRVRFKKVRTRSQQKSTTKAVQLIMVYVREQVHKTQQSFVRVLTTVFKELYTGISRLYQKNDEFYNEIILTKYRKRYKVKPAVHLAKFRKSLNKKQQKLFFFKKKNLKNIFFKLKICDKFFSKKKLFKEKFSLKKVNFIKLTTRCFYKPFLNMSINVLLLFICINFIKTNFISNVFIYKLFFLEWFLNKKKKIMSKNINNFFKVNFNSNFFLFLVFYWFNISYIVSKKTFDKKIFFFKVLYSYILFPVYKLKLSFFDIIDLWYKFSLRGFFMHSSYKRLNNKFMLKKRLNLILSDFIDDFPQDRLYSKVFLEKIMLYNYGKFFFFKKKTLITNIKVIKKKYMKKIKGLRRCKEFNF